MSADAVPITPARFRTALEDLSISSLYAKYAELQNSIAHMESSNKQLEDFARENDDRECYEALLENKEVIKRFLERIELIKTEVIEVRGLPWRPQGEDEKPVAPVNGTNGAPATSTVGATATNAAPQQQNQTNGNPETQNGEEEGVFL